MIDMIKATGAGKYGDLMRDIPACLTVEAMERTIALGGGIETFLSRRSNGQAANPTAGFERSELLALIEAIRAIEDLPA